MAKRKTSNGQKEPLSADGAEGAAAQGPGDPVKQDSRAEAAKLAGHVGAADDFADAVMGVHRRPHKNASAAEMAAVFSYRSADIGQLGMEPGFAGNRTDYTHVFAEAASFVRKNPTVPIDALPIHLKLKGFEVPPAGRRELLAWRVFAFVLAQLDQADRDDAADAARQASEAEAAKPRGVLLGRLAMKPIDRNPLSQMGKVLQRQKR